MAQIIRLCIIGDELVCGSGDPRGLGWIGRVLPRTALEAPLHVMPLGIPGESTTALAGRWEAETAPRFRPEDRNYLIVQVGVADLQQGISQVRTRLNLANIVDGARAKGIEVLLIGPPPLPWMDQDTLAHLNDCAAEVAARREITFIDIFEPLRHHDQWLADLAASHSRWPGQAGYGLIAWLVLHRGWLEWLGATEI